MPIERGHLRETMSPLLFGYLFKALRHFGTPHYEAKCQITHKPN
jgi:hypothetical protein